jgi:hypothetical protein
VTDKVFRSSARLLLVAAIGTASLATTAARAEVVEIVWDSSGTFQRAIEIEPLKFAEVCGRLRKGQAVAWSFRSGAPLNFNIHYHEGSSVVFPAKRDQTVSLEGRLEAPTDQDYCWMWQNGSAGKDAVSVVLRRG